MNVTNKMKKGVRIPQFSAHFALARSPISATAELLFHGETQQEINKLNEIIT